MIWLTWQQHRLMVFVGGLVLVLLIPFLIITGLVVIQASHAAIACPPPDTIYLCRSGFDVFVRALPVIPALSSLPLLIGAFVGAPLVARELEQGTYLLAWTQGVSRRRWLLAKLGVLVGLSCLGFAALDGLMAWWSAPVDLVVGPWLTFDVYGLVPFAYTFFALSLGVAAGTIVRQTVGAMFATGAIFVAVRLAVVQLRPYFLPPLSTQLGSPVPWTILVAQKASQGLLYQPVDRFWMFQGIEAAIFVALALALLALTLWWMRQRIA